MASTQPKFVYLLNRARQSLMAELNARSEASLGISATQLSALFIVAQSDGCSMKHLRDTLRIDGSAITGLVKRMQTSAVIEKRADPADGRASQLFLTKKGAAAVRQGSNHMRRVHTEMIEGFNDDELRTVARFLDALNAKFSQN